MTPCTNSRKKTAIFLPLCADFSIRYAASLMSMHRWARPHNKPAQQGSLQLNPLRARTYKTRMNSRERHYRTAIGASSSSSSTETASSVLYLTRVSKMRSELVEATWEASLFVGSRISCTQALDPRRGLTEFCTLASLRAPFRYNVQDTSSGRGRPWSALKHAKQGGEHSIKTHSWV